MLRIFPNLLFLAVLASVIAGSGLRAGGIQDANDAPDSPEMPAAISRRQKPVQRAKTQPQDYDESNSASEKEDPNSLEKGVPPVEIPIPGLDSDGAAGETFPGAGAPYRWLDQNDQFLNEGDPYPPGQDPFREWACVSVGWFAGVELTATTSEVHSEVTSANLSPGDPFSGTFSKTIRLPVAELNWTAMPRVFVGYRSENGYGEYIASYRYMQSQGNNSLPNFDASGTGQLSSRLQIHVLDLDYAFTDQLDGLSWLFPKIIRRSMGMRTTSAIFDSTANGQQIIEERAGSVFIGAGARANFEGTWTTSIPSVSFNAGSDISGIVGFNYQRFGEQFQTAGGVQRASGRTDGGLSGIPILNVRAGLSWIPEWGNRSIRLSAGYQWEQWWITSDTGQENEINLQGPYIRGEYRW